MNLFENLVFSFIILAPLLSLPLPLSADELSDYTDCSETSSNTSDFAAPLSKAERLKQLDATFVRVVSKTDRCEKSEETSGGGGGGDGTTMSKNASTGGESIAVNESLNTASSSSEGNEVGNNYLANGKEHEDLETADNKATLLKQIKAQADQETDTELKKILMEKYESLKSGE